VAPFPTLIGLTAKNKLPGVIYTQYAGSLLAAKKGTEEKFLRIAARNAAAALSQFHERQWVHCDIAPRNFLVHNSQLDKDARVLLCDFGLSRPIGVGHAGAEVYSWPPERYKEPESPAVPAADVWSFGIFLLELFGSKQPPAFFFLAFGTHEPAERDRLEQNYGGYSQSLCPAERLRPRD